MAMISDRDRGIIRNRLENELAASVKLIFFTQHQSPHVLPGQECPGCRDEHQLLVELAQISPKLVLEVHDFVAEADGLVKEYQIEEIPALVLTADGTKGVRYYGLTSGYEFASLIEDTIDVSKGRPALSSTTVEALAAINEPVHIRVFVTPT